MKELSQDEIALLEKMKSNCLKKGQYIDDKAKDKFKMLCHLEDFGIAYYELLDVINELEKWLEVNLTNLEKEKANNTYDKGLKQGMLSNGRLIKNKLQELKGVNKE